MKSHWALQWLLPNRPYGSSYLETLNLKQRLSLLDYKFSAALPDFSHLIEGQEHSSLSRTVMETVLLHMKMGSGELQRDGTDSNEITQALIMEMKIWTEVGENPTGACVLFEFLQEV